MPTRKDSKGRLLQRGESQRPDGRYQYTYTDAKGKRRCVYSWTLTTKDKTPTGKKKAPCLRDMEAKIQRDRLDGIAPDERTVCELARAYVATRTGVRDSTKAGYQTVLRILERDEFGSRHIDRVVRTDAMQWLIKLQKDGRGYSSIHSIRGVLRPAFQMAEDDDLIRKNPFDFELSKVLVNDSVTREALTRKQESEFLRFVREDGHYSRYYDAIFILFKTGLRISEFCGLTVRDIDFENASIRVERQLQRTIDMRYVVQEPKTASGTRYVPMTPEVSERFSSIVAACGSRKSGPVIDGVSGFLFLDKNGMPLVAMHWEHYFQHIVAKYNRIYREQMPKVTPHVCRHTFCSNMAKSGMNPKKLQYIMGHSDISVTLNVYTHLGFEDVKDEMQQLAAVV